MKFSKLFFTVTCLLLAFAFAASAADDNSFKRSPTNAPVASTNYTTAFDTGNANTSEIWRSAYLRGAIPALPNCTNTAVTRTFTLESSTNNSTWEETSPLIQARLVGIASTGTGATNYYLPIPPAVNRYLRVRQGVPAAGGDDSALTNTWQLVVP